eukprot:5046499-Pleurochrysis_carterae.AAC.2
MLHCRNAHGGVISDGDGAWLRNAETLTSPAKMRAVASVTAFASVAAACGIEAQRRPRHCTGGEGGGLEMRGALLAVVVVGAEKRGWGPAKLRLRGWKEIKENA